MKKLIVLSTVLLTAALTLNSCDKKTGTEGEPATEPVATEAPIDTVAQPQTTDGETPIATPTTTTTTTDTLTQNK